MNKQMLNDAKRRLVVDRDPLVKAALQKQRELWTQEAEIEAGIEKLKTESERDSIADRAQVLLQTGRIPESTLDADLDGAHYQLRIVKRAISLQKQAVKAARNKVAKQHAEVLAKLAKG